MEPDSEGIDTVVPVVGWFEGGWAVRACIHTDCVYCSFGFYFLFAMHLICLFLHVCFMKSALYLFSFFRHICYFAH